MADILGIPISNAKAAAAVTVAKVAFPVALAVVAGYGIYRGVKAMRTTPETDEEYAARMERVLRELPAETA